MALPDPYGSATKPAASAFGTIAEVVTLHDTNDAVRYKYIICGSTGGTVICKDENGTTLTLPLAAGEVLKFRPSIIMATGTTATPLYGVLK